MSAKNDAVLRLRADLTQLRAGLTQASTMVQGLAVSASSFAAKAAGGFQKFGLAVSAVGSKITGMGNALSSMAASAMKTGIALAAMMAPIILQGSKFEESMSAVKAVVNDLNERIEGSAERFQKLNNLARELGATTKFSASQVAEGMKYLGMSGFTTNEILVSTRQMLALAAAGALELGRTSEIAADTMRGLGMAAGDMGRIADVLAATAASANTNIEMLGETMKYAAPLAGAVGQSIEQVSAAAGVLANSGIKASSAGTGLSQMMSILAKGGENVSHILEKYGLTLADVNPAMWSLTEILGRLQSASMSAGDMMELFGMRAGRTAIILAQNADEVARLAGELDNAGGRALEMSEIMVTNVRGDFIRLWSAIESFNISIFDQMKSTLHDIIVAMTNLVNKAQAWAEENKELVAGIGKILLVVGGLSAAFAVGGGAIAMFIKIVGGILTTIGPIITGLFALVTVKIALIVGVIGAVLIPVIDAIRRSWDDVKAAMKAFWDNVAMPIVKGFIAAIKWLWGVIKPVYEWVVRGIQELIKSLRRLFEGLAPLRDMIMKAAAAFGKIALAPIAAVFMAIGVAIRFVVGVLKVAVDLSIAFLNAFGAGIETSSEREVRLAREAKAAAAALVAQGEAAKKYADENIKRVTDEEKLLELLTKKGELEATELDRLAELLEGTEASKEALAERVAGLDAEIAALNGAIAKAEEYGQATEEQVRTLTALKAMQERAVQNLDRYNAAVEEGTLHEITSAEQAREMAAARREEVKNTQLLEEAQKRLKSSESELANLEKELRESTLKGFERELEKVEELRAERTKLLQTRLDDLQVARDAAAALRQETAEMDKQIANVRDLIRLTDERAAAERARLIEEQKNKEREFVRDSDIEDAKRRGDRIRAAQLEAQKMIETEGKRIDEVFALDKKRAEEEKRRVAERARDVVRAAVEAQEKERDPLVGAAEREKEIEKSATDQVVQRVRSVQDLIVLYQVLAMIREAQEERARAAAVKAVKDEQLIRQLEERRDAARTDAERRRLQNLIDVKKAELGLQQGVAKKRAGEAGLEGAAGNMEAQERQKIVANLRALEDTANEIKVRLNEILGDGMRIPIEGIVVSWVDSAVNSWTVNAVRLVDSVAETMAQIKAEMGVFDAAMNTWVNPDALRKNANFAAAGVQAAAPVVAAGPNPKLSEPVAPPASMQPSKNGRGGVLDTLIGQNQQKMNLAQNISITIDDLTGADTARRVVMGVLGVSGSAGEI